MTSGYDLRHVHTKITEEEPHNHLCYTHEASRIVTDKLVDQIRRMDSAYELAPLRDSAIIVDTWLHLQRDQGVRKQGSAPGQVKHLK